MQSPSYLRLLFGLLLTGSLLAQEKGELSMEYTKNGDLELQFWWHGPFESDTLRFELYGAQVQELRLCQGRLKDTLAYRYQDPNLEIRIPLNLDPRSRIYFKYRYDSCQIAESAFFQGLVGGLIFNAFNLEEGQKSGVPGWLIPSRGGNYQQLWVGLLLPDQLSAGLPLEENYTINLGEERVLRYYLSEEPVDLAAFYLVLGEFRQFDPEDFLEELADNEERLEEARLAQFRQRYQRLINYLLERSSTLASPEVLRRMEGLEPMDVPTTFLDYSPFKPFPAERASKAFAMVRDLSANEQDALEHWIAFHRREMSPKEWQQTLSKAYESGNQTALFWRYFLAEKLASQGLEWADSNQADLNSEQASLMSLAQASFQSRSLLSLKLSYRLQAKKGLMELYLSQPDSSLSFSATIDGRMILKDSSLAFRADFEMGLRDTLAIPIPESPRSIYFNFPDHGLIKYEEQRPLTYWLYDLSKAPEEEQRRRALIALLDQAQPNLLATVIGVALDSGEEELQLLALSKVKDLRPDGRRRLESTLRDLAQDDRNVKLMQKAGAILAEYWSE